jgi:hypothetical protein
MKISKFVIHVYITLSGRGLLKVYHVYHLYTFVDNYSEMVLSLTSYSDVSARSTVVMAALRGKIFEYEFLSLRIRFLRKFTFHCIFTITVQYFHNFGSSLLIS